MAIKERIPPTSTEATAKGVASEIGSVLFEINDLNGLAGLKDPRGWDRRARAKQSTDAPLPTKTPREASVQRRYSHLTIILVKPEGTVARLAEPRAFARRASKTGCNSLGELAMILSASDVAACCSKAMCRSCLS